MRKQKLSKSETTTPGGTKNAPAQSVSVVEKFNAWCATRKFVLTQPRCKGR